MNDEYDYVTTNEDDDPEDKFRMEDRGDFPDTRRQIYMEPAIETAICKTCGTDKFLIGWPGDDYPAVFIKCPNCGWEQELYSG